MTSEYPRYNPKLKYKKEATNFECVKEIISAVRNVKKDVNCPPSKKVSLYFVTESKNIVKQNKDSILRLAGGSEVKFVASADEIGQKTIAKVISIGCIYIPMGELVDMEKEKARLKGELDKVLSEIARANGKLSNQGFVAKAPKQLIDAEREKLNKYIDMKNKIEEELNNL